jgi:hypothetical protein
MPELEPAPTQELRNVTFVYNDRVQWLLDNETVGEPLEYTRTKSYCSANLQVSCYVCPRASLLSVFPSARGKGHRCVSAFDLSGI